MLQGEAGEAQAPQALLPLLRRDQLPRAIAHFPQDDLELLCAGSCDAREAERWRRRLVLTGCA